MNEEEKESLQAEPSFPIVGIGASAGGVGALQDLFKEITADVPMAFVVIQHMMPDRESHLPSILQRSGKLEVRQIEDGMKVEPGKIYVSPPSNLVSIQNRVLHLREMRNGSNKYFIDSFFRSLAEDQRAKSVCVILSGTGADGTIGLKKIKEVGGITVVQSEEDAEYSGMPLSAIETGMVDRVLPVQQIAQLLMKIVQHPYLESAEKEIIPKKEFEDNFQEILQIIHKETGHDFSEYKENTIRRRIERRTAVHQVTDIESYVEILRSDVKEVKALFKDLLINVTNFFREPEAFEALKHEALPRLIQKQNSSSTLRIWVPGCSTGEEAYSIAMIVLETMETLDQHFNMQVFATDLDQDAIQFARRGIYPESIVEHLSEDRLKRFFNLGNKNYEVKKSLRDKVIFAEQNIIKDPPFSHLNLVSCRNVLIYMNPNLQNKIIPLFHYVLDSEGILFLGPSENAGSNTDLFIALDKDWRIYERNDKASYHPNDYPKTPFFGTTDKMVMDQTSGLSRKVDYHEIARTAILESYSPPGVLVNSNYEILYFHGDTDPYLEPPKGDARFNVMNMARGDLEFKINQGLRLVQKRASQVMLRNVDVQGKDRTREIDLIIKPLGIPEDDQGLYLILFDEHLEEPVKEGIEFSEDLKEDDHDHMVRTLQDELRSTKENLYDTIEELETSNEELKSTNEELQSTNEELQSANEELETSREELQSTNEELETVNREMEDKIEQISEANTVLRNLLKDDDYGAIFLDTNLIIRRYTQLLTSIFNIRESDIGRPLSDLTTKILDINFSREAEQVLDTLEIQEQEVQTFEDRWFHMTIKPYRTEEYVIKGVVMRFKDITEYKHLSANAEQIQQQYQAMLDNGENGMLLLAEDTGEILQWNAPFRELLMIDPEDLDGRSFFELLSPDQSAAIRNKFMTTTKKGESETGEMTLRIRGEQRIRVFYRSMPLNINGTSCIQLDIQIVDADDNKSESSRE